MKKAVKKIALFGVYFFSLGMAVLLMLAAIFQNPALILFGLLSFALGLFSAELA